MKSHILSFLSAFALFTLMACGDSSSPDQVPPNQTPHQPVTPVSLEDQQISQLGTFGDLNAEQIQTILANRESIKAELLRRLTVHDLETLTQLLNQTQGITPVQTYVSAFLAMHTVDYGAARDAARVAASDATWDAAISAAATDTARVAAGDAAWDAARAAARVAASAAASDAAWNAASDAAMDAARVAASDAASDAASVAAQPLIRAGLGVLHLANPQEIGTTGYALSELLVLYWLLQNNRIYFENAFNAAREALGAEVTLEQARRIVRGAIGEPNLNTNPFIMQMRSFMDGVDAQIAAH